MISGDMGPQHAAGAATDKLFRPVLYQNKLRQPLIPFTGSGEEAPMVEDGGGRGRLSRALAGGCSTPRRL